MCRVRTIICTSSDCLFSTRSCLRVVCYVVTGLILFPKPTSDVIMVSWAVCDYRIYVLIQAHALIDAHAPAAKKKQTHHIKFTPNA